ncbi:MAG: M3 family metallopeptidase [Thermoanaerobaculia bacterium]
MMAAVTAFVSTSCSQSPAPKTAAEATPASDNPLLSESSLPFQYPPFDRIEDSHFAPAMDAGMAEQLREAGAIAADPEEPTFDNTILALERSGRALGRATSVLFALLSADTNDAREALRAEYAPKLAAHRDAIALNPRLFGRVAALYERRDSLGLDAEGVRLIERYHTDFVRAGAELSEAERERLKEINAELATLGSEFSQKVLEEVNASAVVVDSEAELAGLSEAQIAAARDAAAARGLEGGFVLALQNTTGQPVAASLENRELRRRVYEASLERGSRDNELDTRGIVSRVLALRAERATMLGYPNPAAYVLADETALTPEAVNAMLARLAPAAVANAEAEAEAIQAIIDREQAAKGEPSFELAPWDWSYYTEEVRREQYDFDESELKPYLEMTNVLENGVFYAANQLYGLTFERRTDLPVYHPEVTVYDVFDADGEQLTILLVDLYARESKRGGAWMNSYVDQSELLELRPVVAIHQNVPKPPARQPTLLTWDEVTTMFHEFGHALHGMFSDVKYPYFSGTNVPRDFVEFPSQVNEMWADWPSVLANYAKHHQTGEPMPQELLDKVVASAKFNQGFQTTEYLAAALLDQSLHQLDTDAIPSANELMDFEAAALAEHGVDFAPVPPRYRTPYFSHIMGGYAAGYYSYIWSEVLDANTVEWIKEHGGLTHDNGDRFRDTLLSQGNSKDPLQLFRDFAGHEPRIEPLLDRRGLTAGAEALAEQ